MLTHASHVPHGSPVVDTRQFSALPTMRATVVLPQPRGPQNRNAWWTRWLANAFVSVRVTWSCPTTSENVDGRYLRARIRFDTRRALYPLPLSLQRQGLADLLRGVD